MKMKDERRKRRAQCTGARTFDGSSELEVLEEKKKRRREEKSTAQHPDLGILKGEGAESIAREREGEREEAVVGSELVEGEGEREGELLLFKPFFFL
jgi:hypothetical protein